jgi:hypothetical protein
VWHDGHGRMACQCQWLPHGLLSVQFDLKSSARGMVAWHHRSGCAAVAVLLRRGEVGYSHGSRYCEFSKSLLENNLTVPPINQVVKEETFERKCLETVRFCSSVYCVLSLYCSSCCQDTYDRYSTTCAVVPQLRRR